MKTYALIVAGGRGIRMGSEVPKQFLLLKEKPVLMHTLALFQKALPEADIIVALPVSEHKVWERLCAQYAFTTVHRLVAGGDTRFESVKNGLDVLPSEGVVAIHDGVRPLVSEKLIHKCIDSATKFGSAIPVTAISQSLRKQSEAGSEPVDRTHMMAVQTPQCFQLEKLKLAFEAPYHPNFTDDATVYEASGNRLNLVEGETLNIKITTPDDLKLAEAILSI